MAWYLTETGQKAHWVKDMSPGDIQFRISLAQDGVFVDCGQYVRLRWPAPEETARCKSCERLAAKRRKQP